MCDEDYVLLATGKTCSLEVKSCAKLNEYVDTEVNECKACGENCLMCTKDACLACKDGHGAKADSNDCDPCEATPAGLKTCDTNLTDAMTCMDGYGLIGKACTECEVKNCQNCDSGAA